MTTITDPDKCRICGENERTRCSDVCSDEACKITNRLFVWRVKVFKGHVPPKGTRRSSGCGVLLGAGTIKYYNWYFYNHSEEKIKSKLKEVRAKIYLLDKMKTYEGIIKTLNTNYCNQITYSINTTSYEKQRTTFNTLRNHGRANNVLSPVD